MRRIEGKIDQIRRLEDCIRATSKYAESIFNKRMPAEQGNGEGSFVFSRTLEYLMDYDYKRLMAMYNEEVRWDDDGVALIVRVLREHIKWFKSRAVLVRFWYDYREGTARMEVRKQSQLEMLCDDIPGFHQCVCNIEPFHYSKKIPNPELLVKEHN